MHSCTVRSPVEKVMVFSSTSGRKVPRATPNTRFPLSVAGDKKDYTFPTPHAWINSPTMRLTVLVLEWSSHQRRGNRKQNLVSGVIVVVIRLPQKLKHGLHSVGEVIRVI